MKRVLLVLENEQHEKYISLNVDYKLTHQDIYNIGLEKATGIEMAKREMKEKAKEDKLK